MGNKKRVIKQQLEDYGPPPDVLSSFFGLNLDEEQTKFRDAIWNKNIDSIPSNFIYRVDLADFAHIYKMRGKHGGANPEVKLVAEKSCDLLENAQPQITRDALMSIEI